MTAPDPNTQRTRFQSGRAAPSPTSYQPLPGTAPPAPRSVAEIRAALERWFGPAIRIYNWVRSTAAPSDSPMGRIAAWADATGTRLTKYCVILGPIIGACAASVAWFYGTHTNTGDLPGFLFGGAAAGLGLGFFIPTYIFGLLYLAAAYWKWVAGYAAFLLAVIVFRGLVLGLPWVAK
ncbi:MAG: hypothetical protein WC807_17160 [Hyphomicrobium sp.]|jgi:hypothetical protein